MRSISSPYNMPPFIILAPIEHTPKVLTKKRILFQLLLLPMGFARQIMSGYHVTGSIEISIHGTKLLSFNCKVYKLSPAMLHTVWLAAPPTSSGSPGWGGCSHCGLILHQYALVHTTTWQWTICHCGSWGNGFYMIFFYHLALLEDYRIQR